MSQEKFGEIFDVSRTMIGYYETEKAEPSLLFFLKLEEVSAYSFKQICTENLQGDVQEIGKQEFSVREDPVPYKSKVDQRLDRIEEFLKKKHEDF